jgi:molybdate transport system substrate-binding protein
MMNRETTSIGRWLCLVSIAMGTAMRVAPAQSAEITVQSASTMISTLPYVADAFQRETGHTVKLRFGTIGEIQKRVAAGDAADVIIVTDALIEKMASEGLLVQEPYSVIARVGIGVGVRAGALKPDISTANTFKQTLLSAKSIAHPDPARGGVVGNYILPMLERLGIAQAVKEKALLGPGTHPLCEFVAKGEAELCVTQISEISAVKGVTLVGPLPRDLQNVTTFAAARTKQSGVAKAASAFITFITRPSLRAKFAEGGLDFREE